MWDSEARHTDRVCDYDKTYYDVPQSCITGPFLFLMFISNLVVLDVDCSIICHADDTTWLLGKNWENLSTCDWMEQENTIAINVAETFFVLFSSGKVLLPDYDLSAKGNVYLPLATL